MHFEEKTLINGRENDHESLIIREGQTLLAEKGTSLEASQFRHEDSRARRVRDEVLKNVELFTMLAKTGSGTTRRNGDAERRRRELYRRVAVSPNLRVYCFSSLSFFR